MSYSSAAFRPGVSVKVAATTSSGSTIVDMGTQAAQVRVVNTGSVPAFVRFNNENTGNAAAVPTSTYGVGHTCIGAGATDVFTVQARYITAITASSTADLYVTVGEGL